MCDANRFGDDCSPPQDKKPLSEVSSSDYTLNKLLINSDPAALEQLMKQVPKLEMTMKRKFSTIGEEDIRNVIVDAMLYVWLRRTKFSLGEPHAEAVFSKRVYYDLINFSRIHRINEQLYLEDMIEYIVSETCSEQPETDSKCSPVLDAALDKISPRRAAAVRMRYLEELSDQTIGMHLKITESSVRSLISRGLSDLREFLDDN